MQASTQVTLLACYLQHFMHATLINQVAIQAEDSRCCLSTFEMWCQHTQCPVRLQPCINVNMPHAQCSVICLWLAQVSLFNHNAVQPHTVVCVSFCVALLKSAMSTEFPKDSVVQKVRSRASNYTTGSCQMLCVPCAGPTHHSTHQHASSLAFSKHKPRPHQRLAENVLTRARFVFAAC